jgi:hypothetical protein
MDYRLRTHWRTRAIKKINKQSQLDLSVDSKAANRSLRALRLSFVGGVGGMAKKTLLFIFGSAAANIFMIIGVVLLGLTLYFGVNPADGSVVNALVRGTWIHIFLFVTTIPALVVMLVAGDGIVAFSLMFLIQTCVFWTLGRVWVLLFSFIAQQKGKNGS